MARPKKVETEVAETSKIKTPRVKKVKESVEVAETTIRKPRAKKVTITETEVEKIIEEVTETNTFKQGFKKYLTKEFMLEFLHEHGPMMLILLFAFVLGFFINH